MKVLQAPLEKGLHVAPFKQLLPAEARVWTAIHPGRDGAAHALQQQTVDVEHEQVLLFSRSTRR
jgi:hypothetical protein